MTLTSKCSEIKKLLEGSFVIRLADDYLSLSWMLD
jgi:hypothetical protein